MAWGIDKEYYGLVDVQVEYVSHLMDMNMSDWPQSLQDKVQEACKHSMCGEMILEAVISWVKEQHD